MIKLTNSIDFIILTNSASGSIDWTINWRDEIEDNIEPGSASGHISTATTTVLVPAIALAVHRVEDRVIEGIVITNKGVGSQNIQLFKSSAGGTTYALCELYALGAGQSLRITEAGQFLNNALTPSSSVGPQGPGGAAGADGTDGTDGKTVLNGAVDPTTEGVNGDFYINTVSNKVFGPKAGGTWPAGVSLVGPTGAAGTFSVGVNTADLLLYAGANVTDAAADQTCGETFTPSMAANCTGVKFYGFSGHTYKVKLCDTIGTVLASHTTSALGSSGVTSALFTSPVTLTPYTDYVITIYDMNATNYIHVLNSAAPFPIGSANWPLNPGVGIKNFLYDAGDVFPTTGNGSMGTDWYPMEPILT